MSSCLPEKRCEQCGEAFAKSPRYSAAQWSRRRFCTRRCSSAAAAIAQRGRPSPKRIERRCARCQSPFTGHKSRRYCSVECRKAVKVVPWNAGLRGTPGRPRTGTTIPCEHCREPFYRREGEPRRYCSSACYYRARWGGHRLQRNCSVCGECFTTPRSTDRRTCGRRQCVSEAIGRANRGPRSTFWRGGRTAPYVGEWRRERKRALRRDGHRCRACRSRTRPSVHHIVPYRYSQSHALSNLVTLCPSCHGRAEMAINPAVRAALALGRAKRAAALERARVKFWREHPTGLPVEKALAAESVRRKQGERGQTSMLDLLT